MSDTAPGGWKIMRALEMWRGARNKLLTPALDDDESALIDTFETGAENVQDILGRLVRGAVHCTDMANAADRRIAEITARRDRYAARYQMLRGTILDLMLTLGEKRFAAADVTVSIRAGGVSVVVTDIDQLPTEYKVTKTEVSADKRKLKADLDQGVVINGAYLGNGAASLIIRTK